MDIEPLKNYLKGSKDIKGMLIEFLSNKDKNILKNWEYEEKQLYINDRVLCMKRNTLEIECIGRIS